MHYHILATAAKIVAPLSVEIPIVREAHGFRKHRGCLDAEACGLEVQVRHHACQELLELRGLAAGKVEGARREHRGRTVKGVERGPGHPTPVLQHAQLSGGVDGG
jgi:hypothetical protein